MQAKEWRAIHHVASDIVASGGAAEPEVLRAAEAYANAVLTARPRLVPDVLLENHVELRRVLVLAFVVGNEHGEAMGAAVRGLYGEEVAK